MHASAFEQATVFIAPTALSIARVKQVQRLHIKTVSARIPCQNWFVAKFVLQVPFGLDNPKRIAHSTRAKAFGVGFVRTEPFAVGERVKCSSSFKILDQDSFDRAYRPSLHVCF